MSISEVLNNTLKGRGHKLWAEIDLAALVRNYRRIEKLSRGAKVIPVIKADAYGHGAIECMHALEDAGADFFAVATIAEAIELREACGYKSKILILGYTLDCDVDLLERYNITQTVFSLEYARALDDACARRGVGVLDVHIKLDTGMNRLGFDTKDAKNTAELINSVGSLSHLSVKGMFTHFACADEYGSGLTDIQRKRYDEVKRELGKNKPEICHICNSAGIIRQEIPAYDAVRAGIILYGHMPSGEFDLKDFETPMSLKARVAHVHTLKPGDSVSYGATFTADREMKIATLPVGYADGFIRAYSKSSVRINGKDCPIVGRICMDQCMVDVSGADVKQGDIAVIFDSREKVEELAKMSGTITYEVLCLIGKRVPRVYVNKTPKCGAKGE
ncbi:MAG: alanine racemase [Clostridia bacterium]|nr:alanine racemase [Clostridia bacterium]